MTLMLKEGSPFTAMVLNFKDTNTGERIPVRCAACDAVIEPGDKLCYQMDKLGVDGETMLDMVHIECP
jgi:hypothetical protein